MLDQLLLEVRLRSTKFQTQLTSILVPGADNSSLQLYRVPLEHFPSLETYYPERVVPTIDENESVVESKPTKTTTQTKKSTTTAEIDKTSVLFDEKIKDLFRRRY